MEMTPVSASHPRRRLEGAGRLDRLRRPTSVLQRASPIFSDDLDYLHYRRLKKMLQRFHWPHITSFHAIAAGGVENHWLPNRVVAARIGPTKPWFAKKICTGLTKVSHPVYNQQ
jgi:hypothetical protein